MRSTRPFHIALAAACSFLLLVSCGTSFRGLFQSGIQAQQPKAEVLFRVHVPAPLSEDTRLMVEILDDVTGIYFNSSRFELSGEDALNYSIRIPLLIAADIKYRYVMVSNGSSYEFNSQNQQVRYRIARINGPEIIDDLISAWVDTPYSGPVGRISGQILNESTNAPIPDLLIAAGGLQAISSSNGTFVLQGLAPGQHNLVIYSMDGAFETFQQGAVVAENANTPVQVSIAPRVTTKVDFEVTLPAGIDKSLPVRFVSNLFPLGNAYADLAGGSPGSAVNYPVMQRVAANRYTITLELPVGFYLRYKYSLGDGFWNAELDGNSKFRVRDLLVTENLQRKDRVVTFIAKGFKPVHLLVQVPAETPVQESVFLQLNPFGWMEPLPMVSAGINVWKYTLYAPLQYFDNIEYRYCRHGFCELAPERADTNRVLTPDSREQTLSDVIFSWENLEKYTIDTTQFLSLESVQPRQGFIAGVELTDGKPPSWRNSIDEGLQYAKGIGGDWVIITPTWSFTEIGNVPQVFPSPGKDPLWMELMNLNSHVMMSGQKTIIYPKITYTQSGNFQNSMNKSDEWKKAFSEQYERFIYHYADLAQLLSIEGLIIGTQINSPASGLESAIPSTLDIPWQELIPGIRQRYSGRIIAAVSLDSSGSEMPDWLNQVDILYLVYSPTSLNSELSVADFLQLFDSELLEPARAFYAQYNKPVILGFKYDSSNNDGTVNLEGQAKAYSAAILSVASQDWISGFISRGYNPYIELQDSSATIYRKPASEILWFWFHYLLNKSPNE